MNTNFLNNINFSIYGESHGKSIGVIIDNIPSGIEIDFRKIEKKLERRNPGAFYNTKRKDKDELLIESGILNGRTTGTPMAIRLENSDVNSSKYTHGEFRLSHADFPNFLKFGDSYAYAGGGAFSGRLTALIVIVGSIYEEILKNIYSDLMIYSQIRQIGKIKTTSLTECDSEALADYRQELDSGSEAMFPAVDEKARREFEEYLREITKNKNSAGAKIETLIKGLPAGLGELYFDSFESKLVHALFAIPGFKGVLFGASEEYYEKTGLELLESVSTEDGKVIGETNFSGGINGGITNGYQDVFFQSVVKPPTPLGSEQKLLKMGNDEKLEIINKRIDGRHDRMIGNKAIPVIEAWCYIVIADFYLENVKTEGWKRHGKN